MEETTRILVITREKNNIALEVDNAKIQIEKMENFDDILKRLDKDLYDSYDFVVFAEERTNTTYIGHYLPLNIENIYRNQIFINELLINSIIIDNIKYLIDEKYTIQIGIMIRHIIRKDIKYNDFNLNNEIEYISNFNRFSKRDSIRLKDNIYDAVKENYCQNSFLRTIKFSLNKDKIVKKFLFKVYNNIIEDTKKNTEINLVFKKLIGIVK